MKRIQTQQETQGRGPEEIRENLLLYHSGNTSGVRHLARPNGDMTLCGKVGLDYNQHGEINQTKCSEFKGRSRVLGRLCSICETELEELESAEGDFS